MNSTKSTPSPQKAVVLFSGGLDSTTCLYWAKARFDAVAALSFAYGQRHSSELAAATNIASTLGVRHEIVGLDIAKLGGSALTNHSLSVPVHDQDNIYDNHNIPSTYVPARNTIFLAYALGLAEVVAAQHIVIGVSSVDYSGYPDCRSDFIRAFETMANLATVAGRQGNGVSIHTPLQHLSKAQTLRLGMTLGVDYSATVSCYQADEQGLACGVCDSCHLRRQGFAEAGVPDPTRYRLT